jgi:hypothetical protein
MSRLVLILALPLQAAITSLALAAPDPATQSKSQLIARVKAAEHQLELINQTLPKLRAEITWFVEDNKKTSSWLVAAREANTAAQSKLATLQVDIDKLTAWGVEQQTLKNTALLDLTKSQKALSQEKAAHAKTLDRYHRLKLIAGLIAAVVGVLAFLQLMPMLGVFLGPYAPLLPVGGGALGFALAYFLL